MTLDEAITHLNTRGFLVHNLYQREDGCWRASLRQLEGDGSWFPDFAEGDTILEALLEAIARVIDREPHTPAESTSAPGPRRRTRLDLAITFLRKDGILGPDDDYETILAKIRSGHSLIDYLGFGPKPPPIKRRI